MSRLVPLGHDVFQIDAYMHDDPGRLSCYVYGTSRPVVIESGPSRSLYYLTDALDAAGIEPAMLLLTHIHLDHAGGAGHFLRQYPEAVVGVHPRGAGHLAAPDRLWASASRIYGEQAMLDLWGPMEPVAIDRIVPLEEGDQVSLGNGRRLDIWYTPGHASHHITPYEAETGACFVGDVVGIRFPEGPFVMPVTPPPDFDPDLITTQLHRIGALAPDFIAFAHFGLDREIALRLEEADREVWHWVDIAQRLERGPAAIGQLRDTVLGAYRHQGVPDATIEIYDKNTYWPMQPDGIFRWLDRPAT